MEILFLSASRKEKGCNVFFFTLLLSVYSPITRRNVQERCLSRLLIGNALQYLNNSIVLPLSYKCILLLECQLCIPQEHAFFNSFLTGYKVGGVEKVEEKRKYPHMSQLIKISFFLTIIKNQHLEKL